MSIFKKKSTWKLELPQIIPENEKKQLAVFCGNPEKGTSTVIDYAARKISEHSEVAILDISDTRTFYMKYLFEEKLMDEEMKNGLTNISKGVHKPIEICRGCYLYTESPMDWVLSQNDYMSIAKKLLSKYDYVLVDAPPNCSELFRQADSIYIVTDMNLFKSFKDKQFIENVAGAASGEMGKINIVFNKVCNDFVNMELMVERLCNNSSDIYYSCVKLEPNNFFEIDYMEKVFTNPLGIVRISHSKKDRNFLNQINYISDKILKI